jgi:myo-inositol-1(or 4)-monophosphatase
MTAPADPRSPLQRELEVASELAVRAGAILLRHRERGVVPGEKAGGEMVTAADLESDALLRAGLAHAFPGDALLSEESGDSPRRLSSSRVWILDPIDGTEDFASGGAEHGISIGLAVDGEAMLGVVLNPATGELFAGAVGAGVTLSGSPARASAAAELPGARLTTSRTEWASGLARLVAGLPVRPLSSSAYKLARVAAGLDDGTFSLWPRREWDVCAGVALVRAAGGIVTLLDGAAVAFNRRDVKLRGGLVAAGPRLHGALREELARRGAGA